jgi:hypothetical protein
MLEANCSEDDCGAIVCGSVVTAAWNSGSTVEYRREWGYLDEDHQWEREEDDLIDTGDDLEGDGEVCCHHCIEEATGSDWTREISETREEDEEWFVRCGGCNREIEFGWSRPNRTGRIWPAECRDFRPGKSFVEPRYEESWAEKGWLRQAVAA